jgi:hypothetical protein
MKYFTFFLTLMLGSFLFSPTSWAQTSCQPKSCAKQTAEKASTTTQPYLTVDFKAITQPKCSKKSQAKVVKTSGSVKATEACKPACDPKDCPPVCGTDGKAKVRQAAQQVKTSCDPEDCPPECKKHC